MAPTPYPYQVQGVEFLASAGRAILADEPGLGKTPQALLAAQKLDAFPILVVCPKPAVSVWQDEAAKWLEMDARTYLGPARRLDRNAPVVITSYGVFGELLNRAWPLVVFDEAHKLRNRKTKTLFQQAKRNQSAWQFLLTGTPQVSGVDDLWALFHLTDPREWRSYWNYVERYMHKEHNGFGWQIYGAQRMDELRERTRGIFLRRLERVVAPERPPLTRQPIRLELTGAQKRAYEQAAEDMLITLGEQWTAIPTEIAKLTRLRQILVTPLLLDIPDEGEAFRAIRENLETTQHPSVIFTPFAKAIPHLQQYLSGVAKCYVITGDTRFPGEVAKAFERDDARNKALLATVFMGESWSATSASHCYMLGYDWSPTTMLQAERRLQRHGQIHPVVSHYYLYDHTVDEHVMDVLDQKTTLRKLALEPETLLRGKR